MPLCTLVPRDVQFKKKKKKRVVKNAQRTLARGGGAGAVMEDVKGTSNIVKRGRLIEQLKTTEGGTKRVQWVEISMHERTFSVEWDGVARGAGRAGEGVLQGSPLSPILFLIYLAPKIYRMEERIRRVMSGLEININSYVDDIALTLFDGDRIMDMGRMC